MHKPKIRLSSLCWPDPPCFVVALFLSFFLPLLLLLAFARCILSVSPKMFGVDFVESGNGTLISILGVMGHFTTNFAPKTSHVFLS